MLINTIFFASGENRGSTLKSPFAGTTVRAEKTLEAEILKEVLEHATGSKKQLRLPPSPPKDGSR